MKLSFAAIAVLLLLSASPDRRTRHERALDHAVQLRIGEGTGMGLFISKTTILTAAHVSGNPGEIWACRPDGTRMRCTRIRSDEARDLALLSVAGEGLPIRLASEGAKEGDPLHLVAGGDNPFGHDEGYARKVYKTIPEGKDTEIAVLETSCTINLGSSGSGVLNADGELVGICSYFDQFRNNAYVAIDLSEIKSFLRGRERWN